MCACQTLIIVARHAISSWHAFGQRRSNGRLTRLFSPCAGPYAGWRLPFVIVAVPTLLLALLMLLTAEEPPRGVTEAALQVWGSCPLGRWKLVMTASGRKL